MKRNFWLRQLPLALGVCALVITAAAWQGSPGNTKQTFTDTTPQRKIKDIDDALAELERARAELETTLSEKAWEKEMKESLKDFDAGKIRAEIENAMKEMDAAKIQAEIKRSMSQVDFEKMKKEMQESMKDFDSEKIKEEISKAMEQVNAEKIQAQIDASLANVDFEKIKAEMERVKEVDLKKIEEELKTIGPKIEQSMQGARESMEKAKKDLLEYKAFLGSLEKNGLINKNDTYIIEYKNGELTINGKKQPAEVLNRYKEFLKDRREFTIKKDKDDFNIDMD